MFVLCPSPHPFLRACVPQFEKLLNSVPSTELLASTAEGHAVRTDQYGWLGQCPVLLKPEFALS